MVIVTKDKENDDSVALLRKKIQKNGASLYPPLFASHLDPALESFDLIWMRPKDCSLTGKGRTIAIIDYPLWPDHGGYAKNVVRPVHFINEADQISSGKMHSAAVVSIAVGDIGIAPEANVLFWTNNNGGGDALFPEIESLREENTKESLARADILFAQGHAMMLESLFSVFKDIKKYVESGNNPKIDVISASLGWRPDETLAKKLDEIVDWFENKNIPVFCSTDGQSNLYRKPKKKPPSEKDVILSCCQRTGQPYWLSDEVKKRYPFKDADYVFIPMDRPVACWTSEQIKEFGFSYYRNKENGMSWAIPFFAGLFALAREANPDITREQFFPLVRDTARNYDFGKDGVLPVVDVNSFVRMLTPLPSAALNKPCFKKLDF